MSVCVYVCVCVCVYVYHVKRQKAQEVNGAECGTVKAVPSIFLCKDFLCFSAIAFSLLQ